MKIFREENKTSIFLQKVRQSNKSEKHVSIITKFACFPGFTLYFNLERQQMLVIKLGLTHRNSGGREVSVL